MAGSEGSAKGRGTSLGATHHRLTGRGLFPSRPDWTIHSHWEGDPHSQVPHVSSFLSENVSCTKTGLWSVCSWMYAEGLQHCLAYLGALYVFFFFKEMTSSEPWSPEESS